ncbi:zinc-ribbon-domain-containing protein [Haematococcus lacustris]
MCAAVRASLETHIRAEESELWPLFTEHFSTEEQQYLVGVIIGRTGAQVLQTLLPWIAESFCVEEKEQMLGSLRQATKNTMFDQWLEAVTHTPATVATTTSTATTAAAHTPEATATATIPAAPTAAFWAALAAAVDTASDAPSQAVESSTFRPGWEDIFRMNQKQLEAAVMRVSADPTLEPGRKAYLIQNIMVSKYIVAQQRRMQQQAQRAGQPELHTAYTAAAHVRRTFHDAAAGVLGCKHYKRRAQLVAPCCSRVVTCRLCHDEAETHRMDRYAVTEMVCMECGVQQPVAGECWACAAKLARYYCNICHLLDDEPGRSIYHCPFCNVCRRGRGLGIDFFHCMSCNSCMSLSMFKKHVCRERAMESNCPVCSEYLFDSADPIKELPCGHLLHSSCFAEYTRYNYTCPLCSKSVGDMRVYFQMLDSLLASETLPPEYSGRMQQVLCNDCSKTGFARFHFAYHACPHCRSYNTRVI